MSVLSFDFGGSSVKYAVVGNEGQLGAVSSIPAPLDSKEQVAEFIAQAVSDCPEEIDGIGISLPGYIDENGTLAGSGAYMNLWGVNIPELLKPVCGKEVTVINDGKAGALAETWNGALDQVKDGIVLIIGTGLAGGIIKDGKIHMGRDDAAGEFSYYIQNNTGRGLLDGAIYNCGMVGMTYQLCRRKKLNVQVQDSPALITMLDQTYLKYHPEAEPLGDGADVKADGRQLFKWLEEGDADAKAVYENCISTLAGFVMNLQAIYGPEKIAIGGGITRQKRVVEDIKKEVEVLCASFEPLTPPKPEVVPCKYVAEPNIVGAARYFYMKQQG